MDALRHHMAAWDFPWLLSNVLDAKSGQPLAGAARSLTIEWGGLRIGLLGLVEREWLLTIPSLDPNKDITYLDFVEEGRRLAAELHADGVDLVVALTHMRSPNDEALAAQVPEIQLILGGHDHDYVVTPAAGPYGTAIVKSGTDFREFSVIRLEVPAVGSSSGSGSGTSSNGSSRTSSANAAPPTSNGSSKTSTSTPVHLPPRPRLLSCERVEISSALPEHPGVAAIVADYQELMDTHMDQPLGRSFVDLDTRFDRVRCKETNAGSLLADIMRLGLDADAAFLNGGTIRSDQIHEAGRVSMRDFVAMLPFTDELVVVELDGAGMLQALETGVSSWPKKEGRFLQVSGIQFRFDPEKAPGGRVDVGSVRVGGAPLDITGKRRYRVATKAYLRSGKDGFDSLLTAQVVVDGETAPRLATLVFHLLSRIEELNEAQGSNTAEEREEEGGDGHHSPHQEPAGGRQLRAVCDAPLHLAPCAHGLDALYFYDEITGQFGIAPTAEGRIVNVAEEGVAAAPASSTAPDTPLTP